MALVFEPGTGGGDGVCGALSSDFVENAEVGEVVWGEGGEGLEESEARGCGGDNDLSFGRGRAGDGEECWIAGFEAGRGELGATWRREAELGAGRSGETVG